MASVYCNGQIFADLQAVVFDKDGTLARSEAFLYELAQRRAQLIDAQVAGTEDTLLSIFGIKHSGLTQQFLDPTGLMAVGTRSENEAAAAHIVATNRSWEESIAIVQTAFAKADQLMPAKAAQTPLIEGALELIQQLTDAGLKLAMLSSDSRTNVEEFVSQFELRAYFEAVYGVDQQYSTKSDPELLRLLFTLLRVAPEQTLMIGDSQADANVAITAGMAGCIGFTGGWRATPVIPQVTVLIDQLARIKIRR